MNIHIKLTIMALLWAGGMVVSKLIAEQAGPFTIAFLRFFIATIILGAAVALSVKDDNHTVINKRLFVLVFCAAFLGVFCYNVFLYTGIKLIDASRGSVIISTVPIVIAIFSFFVFKEKMSIWKLMGICLSITGAWVVISKGELGLIFSESIGRGELYLMLCVLCAAGFTLFSKQILHTLKPLVTMMYISSIGTAFLFMPAVMEMRQSSLDLYSTSFIVNLLYLAIGPSVFASVFYHQAIRQVGPSKASQYMNLIPVFAVVMAVVFLGEPLTYSLLIGGALVTAGLYLTNLST